MTDNQLFIQVEPEHDFRIKVFVPWQRKDWIAKIRNLSNRAWNEKEKYWSVPKTAETLLELKKLFGNRLKIPVVFERSMVNWELKKVIEPLPIKSNPQMESKLDGIKRRESIFKPYTGKKIVIQKKNKEWLKVWVPYDKKGWIEIIKSINGRKWENEEKYWLIPYVKDSIERLQQIDANYLSFNFRISENIQEYFNIYSKKNSPRTPVNPQLTKIQKLAITALENQLLLERKSWRTIKSYKSHLVNLLLTYPKERPSRITGKQIQAYILKEIKKKKITESTQNQLINALKAFYERVCKQKEKNIYLIRPKKKPKQLPNVLSLKEVEQLLGSVVNIKHKAMLSLIYAAGLRKGELINLRKKDIIYSRKCIFVKNSKGKKDRIVMLSPKIENMLRQYTKIHQPKYWLFEGQTRGQYSETSLQKIFTKAKEKSGVNPYITIHGLRHSFATHLHESGIPLHAIKDLLGHNSIKTTEIYMHISNKFRQQIQSPFDFLKLK